MVLGRRNMLRRAIGKSTVKERWKESREEEKWKRTRNLYSKRKQENWEI